MFCFLNFYAEINSNSSLIQYELLDTLEFTSDRKRMSVVVRECQSRKIFLLSKGADEAVLPYACTGNILIFSFFWLLFLNDSFKIYSIRPIKVGLV